MEFYKLLLLTAQVFLVSSQTNLYKLPEHVRPISYVLTLETNLEAMVFKGTTKILLNVTERVSSFSLHSKELIVTKVALSRGGVNLPLLPTGGYNFTTSADLLNIYPAQPLQGENILLDIEYNAVIGNGNVGYYRAFYTEADNRNVSMAVTHLEAVNARRAFPCFDQPNFKAIFQIQLTRKRYQVTSSNMALVSSTPTTNQDTFMDTYETSVIMSTYLVAFMVSEYGSMSIVEDGIIYRTFARPELLKRGDASYSLNIAPAGIRQMKAFTDVSYSINKMDQVPVPNNYYKIGAMENWGMVTYRERMLMYNSELSTAQEKQSIATIIIHEFAHQWFGDLVTPEWWDYIWLNEGFATYFEQYITSLIETSWDLMEQFVTANVQPAFNDDALEGSKPMRKNVLTPTEIDRIYDKIVYEKAGSVIRMTEEFLGPATFQRGLQSYLKSWSYDTVNPTKLYDSWQNALNNLNLNVTAVLLSWETQAGYPVVTVTRNYGSNSNSVSLKQERFYINRETGSDSTTWMIPLNYFTEKMTTGSTISWLNTATFTMNINIGINDWIMFNRKRKGFYRVNYDETNWKLITDFLHIGEFGSVPVENRAQLIDDAFNLARAGRLNYAIAMELATYVTNETHYVPISTFNSVLSFLDRLSTGHDHHDDLKEYAIRILKPIYKKLDFVINSTDSHLDKLIKVNVNTWLCNYGYKKCLDESRNLLNSWLNKNAIQPDMQSYVYCYGMRQVNETQHNIARSKYIDSREDTEKARIATGLGCANNITILRNFLQHLISADLLTQTDKLNAFTSVYTNNGASGVDLILDFLRTNFAAVKNRIGNIASIISGIASRITTSEQMANFRAFATQVNNDPSTTEDLKDTVVVANTTATNNVAWITKNKEDIILYLAGGSTPVFCSIMLILACIFTNYIA